MEINDFSCVKNGSVSMAGAESCSADILGVYGQNGSGKSALVHAFAFLRLLLCGAGVDGVGDYVRMGQLITLLKASFLIFAGEKVKVFDYTVKIERNPDDKAAWFVAEEKAFVSDYQNPKNRMGFEYSASDAPSFVKPASLVNQFLKFLQKKVRSGALADSIDFGPPELFFLMQREMSRFYKSSYLFQPKMLFLYEAYATETEGETLADYMFVIGEYAQKFMFVMNDSFMYDPMQKEGKLPVVLPNQFFSKPGQLGYFAINLEKLTFAAEQEDGDFLVFLSQINYFLEPLAPEICLSARRVENPELERKAGNYYEVFSIRNGLEIPVKYESLGIKKLISLINVMVLAYKNPSVLVVVDEFDSSINEYVLETFFTAFRKGGKGQLLFTSNNLHPLELLDKNQCCFTTTDESARYAPLKYVKPNNNLRSLYLSEICGNKKDSKNPGLFKEINAEKTMRVFDSSFLKGKW